MHSEAERLRAIELYFKFGRKITSVIRELGYPSERNLRRWVQAWEARGGDISCFPRKECYSDAQKQTSIDHYLTHGCCLAFIRRALGSPCSALLIRWIDELHPGRLRIHTGVQNASAPFKPDVKLQAVRDLCTRTTPAKKIAQNVGVSRQVLYKWKDEAIGDETYQSM